jgi:hypothetical protein
VRDWRENWREQVAIPPHLAYPSRFLLLRDRDSNCGTGCVRSPIIEPDLASTHDFHPIGESGWVRLNPVISERDWRETGASFGAAAPPPAARESARRPRLPPSPLKRPIGYCLDSAGNGGLIWPHCGGLNWPDFRLTCCRLFGAHRA